MLHSQMSPFWLVEVLRLDLVLCSRKWWFESAGRGKAWGENGSWDDVEDTRDDSGISAKHGD